LSEFTRDQSAPLPTCGALLGAVMHKRVRDRSGDEEEGQFNRDRERRELEANTARLFHSLAAYSHWRQPLIHQLLPNASAAYAHEVMGINPAVLRAGQVLEGAKANVFMGTAMPSASKRPRSAAGLLKVKDAENWMDPLFARDKSGAKGVSYLWVAVGGAMHDHA